MHVFIALLVIVTERVNDDLVTAQDVLCHRSVVKFNVTKQSAIASQPFQ